jgi:hypothetical protein
VYGHTEASTPCVAGPCALEAAIYLEDAAMTLTPVLGTQRSVSAVTGEDLVLPFATVESLSLPLEAGSYVVRMGRTATGTTGSLATTRQLVGALVIPNG